MIAVVKVLLFSDTMESVLLEKGEVFSAPGHQISRAESMNASASRCMAPLIGLDPMRQPFWYHIRTEIFQDVMVHVLYSKVHLTELIAMEKFTNQCVIIPTKGISDRSDIGPRLKYMIPMACVLDSLDRQIWPRP